MAITAPRVSDSGDGRHLVEWCSVRCPGDDTIVYRLQLLHAGKDQDYSVVCKSVVESRDKRQRLMLRFCYGG